jgi:hypothetical protein
LRFEGGDPVGKLKRSMSREENEGWQAVSSP